MKTEGIDHAFIWNARMLLVEGNAGNKGILEFLKSVVNDDKLHKSLPSDSVSKGDEHSRKKLRTGRFPFILDANDVTAAVEIPNPFRDSSLHNVTVASQISFEIAEYLFQNNDYHQCLEYIEKARSLYQLAGLDPSNEFIEYDLGQLDHLKKVCEKVLGSDSNIEIYMKKYAMNVAPNTSTLVREMIDDAVKQEIPMFLKRLILQEYQKSKRAVVPQLALTIALAQSIKLLLEYAEDQGLIIDENLQDQEVVNQTRLIMLDIKTADLLAFVEQVHKSIPLKILPRWTMIWQTLVYCNMKSFEEVVFFKDNGTLILT